MERKNERVFYTLEDKTNTEIHSYSDAEIQQNLKKYAKKVPSKTFPDACRICCKYDRCCKL